MGDKDTLVRIAEDWIAGRITDGEARDRAGLLPRGTWHRDDLPGYGDGAWYDGDEDNTMRAVEALAGENGITSEQVTRFQRLFL